MSEEGRKESFTYFNPLPIESWIPSVIQGLFFFSHHPIGIVLLTPHRTTIFYLLFRHKVENNHSYWSSRERQNMLLVTTLTATKITAYHS